MLGDVRRARAMIAADPALVTSVRPDVDRASLLAHALVWRQDAFATMLLERGADPDQPDANGYTPRKLAAAHGNARAASWLSAHPRRRARGS